MGGLERVHTGYPLWLSCFAVFLLSLGTAAGFGCSSVSYKVGGTGRDEQAARDRCRNRGRAEPPEFERCMEEQGWIVKQLGAPAAASHAEKSVPAESGSAGSQPSPATGDVAPSSKTSGASSDESPIVVHSWFKLGATGDELEAATERCVAKLGAAHRPDPKSQVVTPAMLDCLRDEGWRALQSH